MSLFISSANYGQQAESYGGSYGSNKGSDKFNLLGNQNVLGPHVFVNKNFEKDD